MKWAVISGRVRFWAMSVTESGRKLVRAVSVAIAWSSSMVSKW